MVRACHTPRQPLQNHPSRRLGGLATSWSAETASPRDYESLGDLSQQSIYPVLQHKHPAVTAAAEASTSYYYSDNRQSVPMTTQKEIMPPMTAEVPTAILDVKSQQTSEQATVQRDC